MAGNRKLPIYSKSCPPTFHTNGFDHIALPVITNDAIDKIQAFQWGLIPWWV
ncbi:MAG: hypothetical protein M3512_11780 [Bacteroidota bacterium]|nr:hypothetical protein [Bacteroidota bacterium]